MAFRFFFRLLLNCTLLLWGLYSSNTVCAQERLKLPAEIRAVVEKLPESRRDSAYLAIGQQHYRKNTGDEFNIAFSCYMEALSYATRFEHARLISRCHFHIGSVYDAVHSPLSLKYYTLHFYSLGARAADDKELEFAAYTLATLYSREGITDSAMKFIGIMERFIDAIDKTVVDDGGNLYWQRVCVEIAIAAKNLNNMEMLKKYCEKIPSDVSFRDSDLPYSKLYAHARRQYLFVYGTGNDFAKPMKDLLENGTLDRNDSVIVLVETAELYAKRRDYAVAYDFMATALRLMNVKMLEVFEGYQYRIIAADKEHAEKTSQLLKEEQEKLKRRDKLLVWLIVLQAVGLVAVFFAYRKIKRQNATLNNKNRQITEQSNYIQSLIKEVHHRVKNNLQIISSLIDLQQVKEVRVTSVWLKEIQSKMRAIALAHQMIYEQENLAEVSLNSYFTEMLAEMKNILVANGKLTYSVALGTLTMDLDRLVPFAIIINESIINTIKHALPAVGECHISLTGHIEGDTIVLAYADNGPGLPASVDPLKSRSLGLRLINKLSAQIVAKLEVNSVAGQKLEYIFRLPLPRT